MIIFAVFLIAAVVAYPVTDYIISDAVERSLPVDNGLEQTLIFFDGPFLKENLKMEELLKDDSKKVILFSPPVNISEAEDVIYNIEKEAKKQTATDIVSQMALGERDINFTEVIDVIMKGSPTDVEMLPNSTQVLIVQYIPYEENILEKKKAEIQKEFENITGQEPKFTMMHTQKGENSSGNPTVVYTKPLEVPLLKLKMSLIIAIIVTLPLLFYLSAKEVTKYVDTKKLNLKEKIPFKTRWLILIAVFMFVLFILGAIYSYFFMAPLFIQFLFLSAAATGAQATYSIYEFVNFIALMTLIFGFIFELPLIIFILNRVGLVPKKLLVTYRKHVYVLFFIVAAIITPPDVISQIIVAIPMIFFYELSVLIVKIFGRRDI